MAEIDNLRGKWVIYQGKVYEKTGSGEMDLSDRTISNVSEIIGLKELKKLTKLNLSDNNISEIKGLKKLTELTEFNIAYKRKFEALKKSSILKNNIIFFNVKSKNNKKRY